MSTEPLTAIHAAHPLARNGLCFYHQGEDGPCEVRAVLAEVERLQTQLAAVRSEPVALAIRKYAVICGAPNEYDGVLYDPDLPGWAYDFLGFDVCNLIDAIEPLTRTTPERNPA